MLSEEQYFQAKSFLRLYKDTLKCMSQVAHNKAYLDDIAVFYNQLQEGHLRKQLVFDKEGNLTRGEFIRASPFFKVFEIVE